MQNSIFGIVLLLFLIPISSAQGPFVLLLVN